MWFGGGGVKNVFVFTDYIILYLKQSLVCSSLSLRLLDFCHRCWLRGHICFHEAVEQSLFGNVVRLARIKHRKTISNESIERLVTGNWPVCHLSGGITVSV